MFSYAGYKASSWSIGDLSNWKTSKVESMEMMFARVASKATSFNLNLSGWDVTKVKTLLYMFFYAGEYATSISLDLSG